MESQKCLVIAFSVINNICKYIIMYPLFISNKNREENPWLIVIESIDRVSNGESHYIVTRVMISDGWLISSLHAPL